MSDEKGILVVGACGLDRLLQVPQYPSADSKVRTTAYCEVGGGNGANTAAAIARLSGMTGRNCTVRLCSKVGDDNIGQQLMLGLQANGVDVPGPLFRTGGTGTTSSFTTIIVSDQEHTRTCLHTPGSCGELTVDDVRSVDLDEFFRNIVHLHSDGRYSAAALALAQEARRRGVSISLDVEKDRGSPELDTLLEIANIVFTNEQQMDKQLIRLTTELEEFQDWKPLCTPNIEWMGCESKVLNFKLDWLAKVLTPSTFFTRWYKQVGKEVVVTMGARGAVYLRCDSIEDRSSVADNSQEMNNFRIMSVDESGYVVKVRNTVVNQSGRTARVASWKAEYTIYRVGVLSHITIVDTTGAGDAFVGGFIFAREILNLRTIATCLAMGSWVAGMKLRGAGAQSALPTAKEGCDILGSTIERVTDSLNCAVQHFP